MYALLTTILIFLTGASGFVVTPQECKAVAFVASALAKAVPVTPWCSSLLQISTVTKTATATTPTTSLSISTTTTTTTITNDITTITLDTTVTVPTVSIYTLTTTTCGSDGSGDDGAAPAGKRDILGRRTITTSSTKTPTTPGSGGCGGAPIPFACSVISSACECLSIPTPSTTVTAKTVPSVSVVQTTTVIITTITTPSTTVITPTTTSTSVSTLVVSTCTCDAPMLQCASGCTDPNQDPNNCGGCGNVCDQYSTCAYGVCSVSCPLAYAGYVCTSYNAYDTTPCVCAVDDNSKQLECVDPAFFGSVYTCAIDSDCWITWPFEVGAAVCVSGTCTPLCY